MESADFLSFVVTRFPSTRPHGISRTSFLVYSRNLRTWATSIFLDFSALGHLIHPIRLIIAFLFVEPRFRYPFLSPLPHDSQAWESLTGSPIASALWDFHPRCTTCPSYPKIPQTYVCGIIFYAFCSSSFLKNILFNLSTIADKAPSPEMLHAVPKLS